MLAFYNALCNYGQMLSQENVLFGFCVFDREPYECHFLILCWKAGTTTRSQCNNHSAGLKSFCNGVHFSPFTDFKQMFCTEMNDGVGLDPLDIRGLNS